MRRIIKTYLLFIFFAIQVLASTNVYAQLDSIVSPCEGATIQFPNYPRCSTAVCNECPRKCGGPGEPACPQVGDYNVIQPVFGTSNGNFNTGNFTFDTNNNSAFTDTQVSSDPEEGFMRIIIEDASIQKCGRASVRANDIELFYRSYYLPVDIGVDNSDRGERQCSGGSSTATAQLTDGGAVKLKFSRRPKSIYMKIGVRYGGGAISETYISPRFINGPSRRSFTDSGIIASGRTQTYEYAWDNPVSDEITLINQGIAEPGGYGVFSNAIANGDRDGWIYIQDIRFTMDKNTFEFTNTPASEPTVSNFSYTITPPVTTPAAVPGSVDVEITDEDNGRLSLNSANKNARDFFYIGTPAINEITPFPNTSTQNVAIEFRPRFNGPAEQEFVFDSDQLRGQQKIHTFSISNSRSPGYVWKGMDVWLKPDFGVTKNGNQLESWRDFTGNENNFGQATTANRPEVIDESTNFYPAMKFTGNQFLNFNTTQKSDYSANGKREVTWYGVFTPDTNSPGAVWGVSDGTGSDRQLTSIASNLNAVGGTSSGYEGPTPNLFLAGQPQVISISYNEGQPNASRIRINGLDKAFFTAASGAELTNELQIGGNGNQQDLFNGLINEMIFYSALIPTEDKPKVDTYFAIKYGITLEAPYVDSFGNIIYPEEAIRDFGNNIVGLSFDDRSELAQKKSTSANNGALIIENTSVIDPASGTHLIMGHDGEDKSLTAVNTPVGIAKTKRTWFVKNTNNMQEFRITVNFNDIEGVSDFSAAALNTFKLLVDNGDGLFGDATIIDALPTAENMDGDEWIEFIVNELPDNYQVAPAIQGTFIQGTAFNDFNGALVSKDRQLKILQNGTIRSSTLVQEDGSFLFIIQSLDPMNDDNFMIFLDHPDDKGITAFSLDREQVVYKNVNLYANHLTTFSPTELTAAASDALTLTNARMVNALGDPTDVAKQNITDFISFDVTNNLVLSDQIVGNPATRDFSIYIPQFSRYRPGANVNSGGDFRIDGYFHPEEYTLIIGRDWRLNNTSAEFIGVTTDPMMPTLPPTGGVTMQFEGRSNKVFGTAAYWNFTKIATSDDPNFFFERSRTTTIANRFELMGANQNRPMKVYTMDENGNEVINGAQATLSTANIPFGSTKVANTPPADPRYIFAQFVRVRDNNHIGQTIIDPQMSLDDGETVNWFNPSVEFENIESINDENVSTGIHTLKIKLSSKSSKTVRATVLVDLPSSQQERGAAADYTSFYIAEVATPATQINANTGDQIQVTFNPAEDEKLIVFNINDDDIFEGDEILKLSIDSDPITTGPDLGQDNRIENGILGAIPNHTYILFDNEGLPSITMRTTAERILEEGETTVNITLNLRGATSVDATLDFSYAGLGQHMVDYEFPTSATITAGTTTLDLELKAIDDLIREGTEDLVIDISSSTNVQELGEQQVIVDIIDNELPPLVTLSVSPTEIFENAQEALVQITIAEDTQLPIEVDINAIGSAVLGDDYRIDGTKLTINPGSRVSNQIKIISIDNIEPEFLEDVILTFNNIVNGRIGNQEGATLQIKDNDPDPLKSVLTVDKDRILGDGRGTSTATLQIKTIDGIDITQSSGAVQIFTSAGSILNTVDNMDGTYSAVITSAIAGIAPIVANVTATLNGQDVLDDASIIFEVAIDTDGDNIYDFCECPNPPNCLDKDLDGIPNQLDKDSDNDGIEDGVECPSLTGDCKCDDSDQDSIPDYLEHNTNDYDQDSLPDFADDDSDNDGKKDGVECMSDGNCLDSDNDGILEAFDKDDKPSDPKGGDTDSDTILDKDECPNGGICPDSDQDGIPDYFDDDANNNGIPDSEECPMGVCPDCDNDGLNNLLDTDDDNNGLADVDELKFFGVNDDLDKDGIINLCDTDDDGDGIRDDIECPNGFPCPDADANGVPDYLQKDNDGDGIFPECSSPPNCADRDGDGIQDQNDKDADGDTILDKDECVGAVDGVCPDTDGDGIPNNLDLDSNGNGIPDRQEKATDCDGDGVKSYLDLDEKCAEVIPRAGIFSPNYDGVNDYWFIENIDRFEENKVTVMNRFGAVVFEMENYKNTDIKKRWNGFQKRLISGKTELMPAGTYFFIIDLGDNAIQTGYVVITK